jgi:hypothetical protein
MYETQDGTIYETTVAELFALPKDRKLFYWFDFGDDWKFSIARMRTAPQVTVKRRKYPRVVYGDIHLFQNARRTASATRSRCAAEQSGQGISAAPWHDACSPADTWAKSSKSSSARSGPTGSM